MQWLQNVTFPTEKLFKDSNYAENIYKDVVTRTLNTGTTTYVALCITCTFNPSLNRCSVAYFGTLHLEATKTLARICHDKGQRAFVGKVCMDRNCAPDYQEQSAEQSLDEVQRLQDFIARLSSETPPSPLPQLVQPIVTPRFAISCSDNLMKGLGQFCATNNNLAIQTHCSENQTEIAFTKSLYQNTLSYTAVYAHFGLLRSNTILAHCVHLEESEIELIKARKCGISHCPT